jgi:hypothetical protein
MSSQKCSQTKKAETEPVSEVSSAGPCPTPTTETYLFHPVVICGDRKGSYVSYSKAFASLSAACRGLMQYLLDNEVVSGKGLKTVFGAQKAPPGYYRSRSTRKECEEETEEDKMQGVQLFLETVSAARRALIEDGVDLVDMLTDTPSNSTRSLQWDIRELFESKLTDCLDEDNDCYSVEMRVIEVDYAADEQDGVILM